MEYFFNSKGPFTWQQPVFIGIGFCLLAIMFQYQHSHEYHVCRMLQKPRLQRTGRSRGNGALYHHRYVGPKCLFLVKRVWLHMHANALKIFINFIRTRNTFDDPGQRKVRIIKGQRRLKSLPKIRTRSQISLAFKGF